MTLQPQLPFNRCFPVAGKFRGISTDCDFLELEEGHVVELFMSCFLNSTSFTGFSTMSSLA